MQPKKFPEKYKFFGKIMSIYHLNEPVILLGLLESRGGDDFKVKLKRK